MSGVEDVASGFQVSLEQTVGADVSLMLPEPSGKEGGGLEEVGGWRSHPRKLGVLWRMPGLPGLGTPQEELTPATCWLHCKT